ncbi:hypothetical protein MKUB_52910 [Mycobacterium kubicae]|uniref:Transposase n=1 Tax=Mycobacterium kubicae TaxID=120959 RepID=A0ABQ1BVU0_9MYCO|nr:hypothetical protein MKUB_52910 [Mycobacterium kubicae]
MVGWLIADHLRTELVADTLDMARMRRKPLASGSFRPCNSICLLAFGHRLREAGLLGSVASAFDNAMIKSFSDSMQIELLDRTPYREHPRRARDSDLRMHRSLLQPRYAGTTP